MSENHHDNPPPQLLLERAALGELPQEIAAAYEVEPGSLADQVEALRASDREILASYPPGEMAAAIAARARSGTRGPRQGGSWSGSLWSSSTAWRRAGALAATAVILFTLSPILMPGGPTTTDPEVSPIMETTRIKGAAPKLSIWRKVSTGPAERLERKNKVRAGDVLQLKYRAAGHAHGVIASLDGRGSVTLHFPAQADASTALEKGGDVALEYGYDLDDAPRFERFFFIASEQPLDVTQVLSKIRALDTSDAPEEAPVAWPKGQNADDFLLYKVTP